MNGPIRRTLRGRQNLAWLPRVCCRVLLHALRTYAPPWTRAAAARLPVPPQALRSLVSGDPHDSALSFLAMGGWCAWRIEETVRRHGAALRDFGAILDFGCGCGRVIRHLAPLKNTRLHGTDYNSVLVEWCCLNLPFAEFALNRLEPPVAYRDAMFDLIYAFSVFTHLPERIQLGWIDEFRRLLKPGGLLAFSTMPEGDLPEDDEAQRRFRAGEMVVFGAAEAGSNNCLAFHPCSYVESTLAPGFEILELIPGGVGQDFWLFRNQPAVWRQAGRSL